MVLPVVDSFLPEAEQYLPRDPEEVLKTGQYGPIPVLMGTTSYEGVVTFTLMYFSVVSTNLMLFISDGFTVLEECIASDSHLHRKTKAELQSQSQENSVKWFLTDTQFKVPVVKQLQQIVKSPEPVYYYIFDQPGPDLYGNIINISGKEVTKTFENRVRQTHRHTALKKPLSRDRGVMRRRHPSSINIAGAAHGSELIYLFGSPLLMSVNGRRFTPNEERFSKIMKKYWIDFVRKGSPIPNSVQLMCATVNIFSDVQPQRIIFNIMEGAVSVPDGRVFISVPSKQRWVSFRWVWLVRLLEYAGLKMSPLHIFCEGPHSRQPMPGQYGHGQQWKRATLKNSNCFVLKYEAQQYPLVVSSKLQSSTDDAIRLWTELFPKLSNLSSKTSTEVATANSQVVSGESASP
ncbi:unnamed protein product, partial [Timema podura]|nr:unnamed protein product [Timema podura]